MISQYYLQWKRQRKTEFWYHPATRDKFHTTTLSDSSYEQKPFMRLGTRPMHIDDKEHVLRRRWENKRTDGRRTLVLEKGYEECLHRPGY